MAGLRERLGRYISKAEISDRLSAVAKALRGIKRTTAIEVVTIIMILAIALTVRLLPVRYGVYLNEYDPYLQFRIVERLADEGLVSYFSWRDDKSWYPFGRDMTTTTYPGLAITAYISYAFLRALGLNVTAFEFAAYFPALMGVAAVFALYVLVRSLLGKSLALMAALLFAFSTSHISRTALGFFDDESVGIFAMLAFFAFYLKAIDERRHPSSSLIYSILAGLTLSYLTLSWGAFRYPLALALLFTFVLVVLRRYTGRLLMAYAVTFGLALFVAMQVPFLGYGYLTEWPQLAVLALALMLVASEFYRRSSTETGRLLVVSGFAAAMVGGALAFWRLGLIADVEAKFRSILLPGERLGLPLIESVAEHRPATWANFYYEFGALTVLGLMGFIIALQRRRAIDIFFLLFAATTLYFSASLIRLTLLLAPALAIMASYAIVELGTPAVDILREAVIFPKRRVRAVTKIGREFGVAIFLVLLIALLPGFWRAVQSAYTPVTIVTSGVPIVPRPGQEIAYNDWLEALAWMRENLPDDAVVFSWWDYGYWITALADRFTLADNGTINATQIAIIAQTFLLNETMALPNLKKYGVTHIAVFVTPNPQRRGEYLGFGEEGKWYWMARIGNDTVLGDKRVVFRVEVEGQQTRYRRLMLNATGQAVLDDVISDDGRVPNRKALLGLLMRAGLDRTEKPSPIYWLTFSSTNGFVHVFKVRYEAISSLSLEPVPERIVYGENATFTGVLKDGLGRPLPHVNVTLQRFFNNTWSDLADAITDEEGRYRYVWKPDAGAYRIRAIWEGMPGEYMPAFSAERRLSVEKANVTLSLTADIVELALGQNVTLILKLDPPLSVGNFTIEYSVDNKTWTAIFTGTPVNGSYTYSFSPPKEGTFYIRVTWSGTNNYNKAVSNVIVIVVKKP